MRLVSFFVLKVWSDVGTAVQEASWRFVFFDVRIRCSCNPQVRCFPASFLHETKWSWCSSVFRTSHFDPNINETSSYCDLSPLYGHNAEVQEKVRAYNGLGYLHPDTFGEDRLLFLPPAVCSILVLFNRNHNVCLLSLRMLCQHIWPWSHLSISLSACSRSMRGAPTKTLLRWPPISALVKTRRSSRLHG